MNEEIFKEEYRKDRKKLRNAGFASGALIFLFMVIPDLIIVCANLLRKNTGIYIFEPVLRLHPDMDMLLGSILQIIGVTLSVLIVLSFYKFSPMSIWKKYGLSNKEKEAENDVYQFRYAPDYPSNKWGILIFLAFPVVYAVNIVSSYIIQIITDFIERDGFVVPKADISFDNLNISTLTIYFLSLCVFAPLLEEFLMRGCMIKILKPFGNWFAIVVSSVMFGLLHNNIGQGFGAMIIGIAFGFIAVKSESIWPTVILHFLNNFLYYILMIVDISKNKYLLAVFSLFIIFFVLCGIVIFIVFARKLNLSNNNKTWLSTKECYLRYFTNVVVLIYLAYNLFNFIYPFFAENNT